MTQLKSFLPHILAILCSLVFLDSLRFKLTNHPNTQEIFGRLDGWAESLGAGGLFAQTGLFSQYVIGGVELIAALCLLMGIWLPLRRLQALGALIGFAVISGAISFHLFTPLGIDPNNDGGGLFVMACIVWLSCVIILMMRRGELAAFIAGMCRAVRGKPSSV